jgi:hypothetical protein
MQSRDLVWPVGVSIVAASWILNTYVFKPWVHAQKCEQLKRDIGDFLVERGTSHAPYDVATLNKLHAQQIAENCK